MCAEAFGAVPVGGWETGVPHPHVHVTDPVTDVQYRLRQLRVSQYVPYPPYAAAKVLAYTRFPTAAAPNVAERPTFVWSLSTSTGFGSHYRGCLLLPRSASI